MTALWLRSVRQRPSSAVLLCLLSSVAVMTSMLGPLLVRAVDQAALTDALDDAGLAGTSLTISSDLEAGASYDDARGPVLEALSAGHTGDDAALWEPPEIIIRSSTIIIWQGRGDTAGANAQINALDDGCDAYLITDGACPAGKDQVMISGVDAERQQVKVTDKITFSLARADEATVSVVGIYDPVASAAPAGLIRPGTTQGVLAGIDGDPLVMPATESAKLPLPVVVTARETLQPGLMLADVPALQASIDATKAAVNQANPLLALRADLPDILQRVDTQARAAQVLILVTGVQALFLAIFALVIVVQRVGRARAAEWSVGRLRGVPRRRWLGSIYTEPLAALLLGLPVGFLAGIVVARTGVSLTLRAGTPVEPWRWPVVASAVGATVLAVGALVAVSLRSLRQPLADLIQTQAEARRLGVLGAVVHAVVFVLAAASVYQLLSGGLISSSGTQLGLLAPGLLALAVAMLAVRGAVYAVRRITDRPPRSLSALVVGRHAARSPSALNPAMIIAIGVALSIFATQVLALSLRNQGLRADVGTGAPTVLTVSVPRGGDLLEAVRAADPSGRYAMAVKDTAVRDYSGPSRVVAVDTTRLDAVSSWSSEWANVPDVATALRGDVSPAIVLRGTEIEVDLADVLLTARPLPDPSAPNAVDPPPPPELVITVETEGAWRTVDLGRLERSSRSVDQVLSADLPCTQGCRLVAVGLRAGTNQPYKASFTITSMATDRQPASESQAWLRSPDRWREQSINQTLPQEVSNVLPVPGPAGLGVEATDDAGSGLTSMSPTDTADPLPVLLAPGTSVEPAPGQQGVGYGAGLDGQQQKVLTVGQASILPRSLDSGVLVDLSNAQGLSDPARSLTIDEVLARSGRPRERRATSRRRRSEGRGSRDGGRPTRRAREPGDDPRCRGRGDHQCRRTAAHPARAGRRALVGCGASRKRLAGAA